MAYSRAAYFCIFCALIWVLEQLLRRKDLPVSSLYGVTIVCYDVLRFLRDLLVGRDKCNRRKHADAVACSMLTVFLSFDKYIKMSFVLCIKQVLPTASQSPSWWAFSLRSTPLPSTCWSRLTCTFLEEQVSNLLILALLVLANSDPSSYFHYKL